MERTLLLSLKKWLSSSNRKPLVLRGARQVGKTWIIRHLAKISNKHIIELNFEKNSAHAALFEPNDPAQILLNLSSLFNHKIDPQNSLLFLDEIQAVPQLFSKLRWFAEDLPELALVAAGSLLEFLIADHSFSMPVGRISYLHLEPLSFEEFLLAKNQSGLLDYLHAYTFSMDLAIPIHNQLNILFKEYILVGGLPAVVLNWIEERSLSSLNQVQNDLLGSYRDDFSKFKGRMALEKIEEVLMATPKMLGQKFVFSRVATKENSIQPKTINQILHLLEKARICHRVQACSANGLPLGAAIKEKYFKEIFLDTGLACISLGLSLNQINAAAEVTMINKGAIAEQVVGQLLRTISEPYQEPSLYYWQRDEKGASSEIDYVITHGSKVIPIEVKAGSTGSLKSLHFFMGIKKSSIAVRINSDIPSKTEVSVKDTLGNKVEYDLLSIPFYLTGQLHRLLNTTN